MYVETDIESLIEIIKKYLKDNLNKIILFGSYANNTANSSSDIDIAIILNSLLDRKEKHNLLNNLWWESSRNGLSIDFIFKTIEDYDNEKNLPTLSKTINNEGKIIWTKI